MCPIGRAKDIEWSVSSKKDPRWNKKGECQGLISMMVYPAKMHIKNCENKYGKWPKDLYYNAHKIW